MISTLRDKFTRVYNRSMQKNANFLFRGILGTGPVLTNPDADTILYCALDQSSCRQYIAAVKSLLRFNNNLCVVAQSDGTLNTACIEEIKRHLPGSIVLSKSDMMERIAKMADPLLLKLIPSSHQYTLHTPVKIMYLKFLNVIFQFNGRKTIIIDSDLLFLRKPEFILDWADKPYTHDFYAEGSNARAADFHAMGFEFKNLDVANFSSGTIGVGGAVCQEELINMFSAIGRYDASLFYAWEIEQALWSIIMATRKNPVNIDELRDVYVGSGWRSYEELKEKAVIAHFAGAVRFNDLKYLRCLRNVIQEMNTQVN